MNNEVSVIRLSKKLLYVQLLIGKQSHEAVEIEEDSSDFYDFILDIYDIIIQNHITDGISLQGEASLTIEQKTTSKC